MKQIRTTNVKDPTPRELQEVPNWKGDILECRPLNYLRELTTYISCLGLDDEYSIDLLHTAMQRHARGWFRQIYHK